MEKAESTYFRHCEKFTLSPTVGKVTGKIPKWLTGTLIRLGPGIQKVQDEVYNHVFDAMGVLHRFHVEDGKATYSNHPVESDTYNQNMKAQRIIVSEFGTVGYADLCESLYSELKSDFEPGQENKHTDNANINVCYYGDQLYAMTETEFVVRVDPETLKGIGPSINISDYVAINSATAHPHVLENGNIINIGNHYKHKKGPHYTFIEIPPTFNSAETSFKGAKIIVEIPAQNPSAPNYFHSFGITEDKVIFIEQPLYLDLKENIVKYPISKQFVWDSKAKTRFYVASMKTGEIHPIVYETDKLFTFHHANAYEKDGNMIVDVAGFDTGNFVLEELWHGTVNKISNSGGSLRRYILPLNIPKGSHDNLLSSEYTGATATLRHGSDTIVDITPQIYHDNFFEFPRMNYKLNGKSYRYIYGLTSSKVLGTTSAFPEPDTIIKVDFNGGKTLSWHEKGVVTPEPVFVANTTVEHGVEDDGIILCPLLYLDDYAKTTLLILDAKNFNEIARIDFRTEGTVTSTFHGQWANKKDKMHLL